jgi:hypothetical protein
MISWLAAVTASPIGNVVVEDPQHSHITMWVAIIAVGISFVVAVSGAAWWGAKMAIRVLTTAMEAMQDRVNRLEVSLTSQLLEVKASQGERRMAMIKLQDEIQCRVDQERCTEDRMCCASDRNSFRASLTKQFDDLFNEMRLNEERRHAQGEKLAQCWTNMSERLSVVETILNEQRVRFRAEDKINGKHAI